MYDRKKQPWLQYASINAPIKYFFGFNLIDKKLTTEETCDHKS